MSFTKEQEEEMERDLKQIEKKKEDNIRLDEREKIIKIISEHIGHMGHYHPHAGSISCLDKILMELSGGEVKTGDSRVNTPNLGKGQRRPVVKPKPEVLFRHLDRKGMKLRITDYLKGNPATCNEISNHLNDGRPAEPIRVVMNELFRSGIVQVVGKKKTATIWALTPPKPEISECRKCWSMTHMIAGRCGKCGDIRKEI